MKQIVLALIGTIFCALATTIFAMPNQIADGGILGIALLLFYSLGWSPGIVTMVAFILLQLVSFKFLPKGIVIKTMVNVPLLSLFIFLTENIVTEPLGDSLVAAIFAGITMGVGFGLIIQAGSSIGGTSTIARLLAQRYEWNVVLTTFIMDAIIVLAGVFIIGPLYTLYTIIALFIGKVASDYVIGGFDSKKAVTIISPEFKKIAHDINTVMSSSATFINGSGSYTERQHFILYIIVPSYRLLALKRIVREVDANAFVVVHNVKDVSGGTFFAATPEEDAAFTEFDAETIPQDIEQEKTTDDHTHKTD
ncbi:YitT family protein [Oceanobacillus locisalsi]|uniref:YitT family protein n=1 Tax=Oceanobacillus locisalsi TaxID=546107 RepID=A0ABW3NE72_9BACI